MGKASSSKKVARAAKAGGSLRERPKLGYPVGLAVIVLLGVALVGVARADRLNVVSSGEPPSASKADHWHAAYGVYICDHFLPALPQSPTDPDGIHTHGNGSGGGDGIMHIHPFGTKASGTNARLKVFAETNGWTLGRDSITIDGTTYANGYLCGDKPARVLVYRWADAFDESGPAEVFDKDFGEIRYRTDRSAFTIAVVPEGTEVPRPESVPTLNSLSDVSGSSSSSLPTDFSIPTNPSSSIPTDSSVPTDSVTPSTAATDPTPTSVAADAPAESTPSTEAPAPSTPPPSS